MPLIPPFFYLASANPLTFQGNKLIKIIGETLEHLFDLNSFILSSTCSRVTVKGLGLGRNPPYILNIVTERHENENDLLPCFERDENIKNHMQKANKIV